MRYLFVVNYFCLFSDTLIENKITNITGSAKPTQDPDSIAQTKAPTTARPIAPKASSTLRALSTCTGLDGLPILIVRANMLSPSMMESDRLADTLNLNLVYV